MGNSYFKFKQFTIVQEKSAMKVGTDGVLLGALAHADNVQYILDIGTGTGLVAIMLAQRFKSVIDAVEIDKDAAMEASENGKKSPWNDRINILHTSFQEYSITCKRKYELIVSNPPFFKNSLKSTAIARNHARHNDALPIDALFEGVNKILSEYGTFQIIVPSDDVNIYVEYAKQLGLFCNTILWVKPTISKPPKRAILTFRKIKKETCEDIMSIESYKRHEYTSEYRSITSEFYL